MRRKYRRRRSLTEFGVIFNVNFPPLITVCTSTFKYTPYTFAYAHKYVHVCACVGGGVRNREEDVRYRRPRVIETR